VARRVLAVGAAMAAPHPRPQLAPIFRAVSRVFATVHAITAALFAGAALALLAIAAKTGWSALRGPLDTDAAQTLIEAVGLLAAAVVALQIAQTITEEEVIRDSHISAPTRVRRFLSRFFAVIVVALAIEGLVAVFKGVREDLSTLVYAAAVVFATATLLAAWGVFVRFNRAAEELEPEAMQEAKREDAKLK
jgi:Ni/Fe-hydrogenase subunit HybB-like protein